MAKYRKLSRTSSQRKALLRGQVTQLLVNGKIVTTEAKAKEVIYYEAGRFICQAKRTNCPLAKQKETLDNFIMEGIMQM